MNEPVASAELLRNPRTPLLHHGVLTFCVNHEDTTVLRADQAWLPRNRSCGWSMAARRRAGRVFRSAGSRRGPPVGKTYRDLCEGLGAHGVAFAEDAEFDPVSAAELARGEGSRLGVDQPEV